MHVKLVKLFVESVMRYGLPIDFTAFILAPKKGSETKVSTRRGAVFSMANTELRRHCWCQCAVAFQFGTRAAKRR